MWIDDENTFDIEEIGVQLTSLWLDRTSTGSRVNMRINDLTGVFTNNVHEFIEVFYSGWTLNGYTT